MSHDNYTSPLSARYASSEMQRLFSDEEKVSRWRKLWVALAEGEQQLGLPIADEQIEEMRANVDKIDFAYAEQKEKEVRHDVMAHVLTFARACPKAAPIIHLGATSCFVGDNADLLVMRDALLCVRASLVRVARLLCAFASKHKSLVTLSYTHFQAAQPTTMGKRATLWLQDVMSDLDNVDFVLSRLKLLGCKGTTGTAASFAELFDGDEKKVFQLEKIIADKFNLDVYAVSGQTYSRKVDFSVLACLSAIAQSASKFANDVRLLSHEKVVEEPFEQNQIGSSAMAFKRNPMRCERIVGLSRYIQNDLANASDTASAQWLERTLDDSANRRLSISEGFLACDGVLSLYANVIGGLTVYPEMCQKRLDEELPFMLTENVLMSCVKNKGANRQALHEKIRRHAFDAAAQVKKGLPNDTLERIAEDETIDISAEEIEALKHDGTLAGLAEKQTERYLCEVEAILKNYPEDKKATEIHC